MQYYEKKFAKENGLKKTNMVTKDKRYAVYKATIGDYIGYVWYRHRNQFWATAIGRCTNR